MNAYEAIFGLALVMASKRVLLPVKVRIECTERIRDKGGKRVEG